MSEYEPKPEHDSKIVISRRRALALGSRAVGGLLAATSLGVGTGAAAPRPAQAMPPSDDINEAIEDIFQAQGMISNGLFSVEIERNDITNVTLHGVPITPAFQINGTIFFQSLGHGRVVMNGDMALKPSEIDPFIDQLLKHDIVFQAEHQHFYDFNPLVWFIHFRAAGDPLQIAQGVKAALNVTSTPFPQMLPANPTTPLPVLEISEILGAQGTVGSDGVVTVDVPRTNPISLGGYSVSPFLNVQTSVVFQPYGGGQNAAAAPDFGMIASEVQNVIRVMRDQAWDIGCLYNQETDEQPQLYFSHCFKAGNAVRAAQEIRRGLDQMDLMFMS